MTSVSSFLIMASDSDVPAVALLINDLPQQEYVNNKKRVLCVMCGKLIKLRKSLSLAFVPEALLLILRKRFPSKPNPEFICIKDLETLQVGYFQQSAEDDSIQYSSLQDEVLKSFQDHADVEENLNDLFERKWTFGERVSDIIAKFGGSWKFIISFAMFILVWCALNSIIGEDSWDPYPFILLNLCLSMLAALQAPVIMMSQNRQDEKDRARAEYDYKINMQAELQVRHLNARVGACLIKVNHLKMDHLITNQFRRLTEMQLHLINSQKRILSKGKGKQHFWQMELKHDPMCIFLLQVLYKQTTKNPFLFEDRFSGADNFLGAISSVEIVPSNATLDNPFKLSYELHFGTQFATLDSIFSGDRRVLMRTRNCFGEECLNASGQIESITMDSANSTVTWSNGKLPPKYKWTLSKQLEDRLTDFWKLPIRKLRIEYSPGQFLGSYQPDKSIQLTHITFFPTTGDGSRLMVAIDLTTDKLLPDLIDDKWNELTNCSWTSAQMLNRSPILVPVDFKLEAGHKYYFFVTVGSVLLTGEFLKEN